jgi:hypothetical protein
MGSIRRPHLADLIDHLSHAINRLAELLPGIGAGRLSNSQLNK